MGNSWKFNFQRLRLRQQVLQYILVVLTGASTALALINKSLETKTPQQPHPAPVLLVSRTLRSFEWWEQQTQQFWYGSSGRSPGWWFVFNHFNPYFNHFQSVHGILNLPRKLIHILPNGYGKSHLGDHLQFQFAGAPRWVARVEFSRFDLWLPSTLV